MKPSEKVEELIKTFNENFSIIIKEVCSQVDDHVESLESSLSHNPLYTQTSITSFENEAQSRIDNISKMVSGIVDYFDCEVRKIKQREDDVLYEANKFRDSNRVSDSYARGKGYAMEIYSPQKKKSVNVEVVVISKFLEETAIGRVKAEVNELQLKMISMVNSFYQNISTELESPSIEGNNRGRHTSGR